MNNVVYFIRRKHVSFLTTQFKWFVSFGTIEDRYADGVYIQLYDTLDTRKIDGVPVAEIHTPTSWMKFPKGWSYDTRLFELTEDSDERKGNLYSHSWADRDIVQGAIQAGHLIQTQLKDYSRFEAEIDRYRGWRLVRKVHISDLEDHPSHLLVAEADCFDSFDEAKAEADARNDAFLAECQRQANLSDYEWSVEQINLTVNHWASVYGIDDDRKQDVLGCILALDDIENVECRLYMGNVQWKYVKNKRWVNV